MYLCEVLLMGLWIGF